MIRDLLRVACQSVLVIDAAIIAVIVRRWVTTVPKDQRRLLFRHVVELGVGVLLLEAAGFALVTSRIGEPFVWYGTPLVLVSALALLLGLVDMLRWLSARRPKPIPERGR